MRTQSVLGNLMSRMGFASLAGYQFGGRRKLYDVYGYKSRLTFYDYALRYQRQDIAKRIVDAPAIATWESPPVIQGPEDLMSAWNEIVLQQSIWSNIERADRLAGLGYYSVLLLGFDDTSDLKQPVNPNRKNSLLYVQPYSEYQAAISKVVDDPMDPRFGMPAQYQIRIADPASIITTIAGQVIRAILPNSPTIYVHASRIVHIAEGLSESNFLGTPRLQGVFNLLDDLMKVTGGTAETYWLASNRGMQIDVDKEAELSTADAAALSSEVDDYQNELSRVLRTKGVTVKPLGGTTPDPKNTFAMIISLISGNTGIPQRILIGSEAGSLASDQDRSNWADRIKERRKMFAEPSVMTPMIVGLMNAGMLPKYDLAKFSYKWPPNQSLTPLEAAQTMAQRARATINLSKQFSPGGTPIMSVEEARTIIDLPPECILGTIPKAIKPPAPAAPTPPKDKGTAPITQKPKNHKKKSQES